MISCKPGFNQRYFAGKVPDCPVLNKTVWGEGVGPTPPLSFFLKGGHPPTRASGQVGGTPLPLRSRPGPATTIQENHQIPHLTPVIPRETQDSAMQKMNRFAAMGGRGVIPLPPLSLFFRRGSPPHPCVRAGGGTHPP
jgi:hypothetical protein